MSRNSLLRLNRSLYKYSATPNFTEAVWTRLPVIKAVTALLIFTFSTVAFSALPNDFNDVVWLGPDASKYRNVSSLSVSFSGTKLSFNHSISEQWLAAPNSGCSDCNASVLMFVREGDSWLAAPAGNLSRLKPELSAGAVNGSLISKAPMHSGWSPVPGREYGFMLIGRTFNAKKQLVNQRSDVYFVVWPQRFKQVEVLETSNNSMGKSLAEIRNLTERLRELEKNGGTAQSQNSSNDGYRSAVPPINITKEQMLQSIENGEVPVGLIEGIQDLQRQRGQNLGASSEGSNRLSKGLSTGALSASADDSGSDGGDGEGDDSDCDTHCFIEAFKAINKSLEALQETYMEPIGESVQQLSESNSTSFASLNSLLIQIARVDVGEKHLVKSKVATLEVKRDINDKFGSVAGEIGLLAEVETPLSGGDIVFQLKKGGRVLSDEVAKTIRGTGSRTAMMGAMPDDESLDLVKHISEDRILEKNSNAAYSLLLKSLTDTVWFPAPSDSPITSAEKQYRTTYFDRKRKIDLASQMIHDVIAQRMYVITSEDNAEFYNTFLREAGEQVLDGFMSEARSIDALGLSQFGSNNAYKLSGLSGDELNRKLAFQMSINNYLRSRVSQEFNDLATLKKVRASMKYEEAHQADIVNALNNSDR